MESTKYLPNEKIDPRVDRQKRIHDLITQSSSEVVRTDENIEKIESKMADNLFY